MVKLSLICILLLIFTVSGCITTPVVNYSGENQKLRTAVSSLEEQLSRLKQENSQLKAQLQKLETGKKEVRMPSGSDIQTALKKAGFYKGVIDGQIGTQTKEAIKKFQEANKINPDGVVGSRTWAAMSKYLEN